MSCLMEPASVVESFFSVPKISSSSSWNGTALAFFTGFGLTLAKSSSLWSLKTGMAGSFFLEVPLNTASGVFVLICGGGVCLGTEADAKRSSEDRKDDKSSSAGRRILGLTAPSVCVCAGIVVVLVVIGSVRAEGLAGIGLKADGDEVALAAEPA